MIGGGIAAVFAEVGFGRIRSDRLCKAGGIGGGIFGEGRGGRALGGATSKSPAARQRRSLKEKKWRAGRGGVVRLFLEGRRSQGGVIGSGSCLH